MEANQFTELGRVHGNRFADEMLSDGRRPNPEEHARKMAQAMKSLKSRAEALPGASEEHTRQALNAFMGTMAARLTHATEEIKAQVGSHRKGMPPAGSA